MEKEAEKKPLVSNSVLLGVLGVLLLVIIGLIVGVVVPKGGGEEVVKVEKTDYEIAQEACGKIQGVNPTEDNQEIYQTAIAEFEGASLSLSLEGDENFKSCYTSILGYYTNIDKNPEKAQYYGDLYDSFLSEEEREELEYMRELKKKKSGEQS